MASIDKNSVREQVDRLTADFDRICAEGQVSGEIKILMQSMLTVIRLIMSIFVEKQTPKNSTNSSQPSSQTDKDESSTEAGPSNKKRKATKGSFDNKRDRVSVIIAKVTACDQCGENLSDIPSSNTERRTKIDIIFERVTEHVDAEIKACPTCDTVNKGRFPENMSGPVQYGMGVKAYIVNLLVTQMIALNRAQQLVHAVLGQLISEATLLKYILQLHCALERWENDACEWMLLQKVLNTDETSLRVDKRNHWIHVYSSGETTLKFLHTKRGKAAIEAVDIIPRYGGTIIHDCWASYFSYDHCQHGLCGSHLVRELTFIVDSNQYRWAKNMRKLLLDTCKTVSKRSDKCLTEKEYTKVQTRYRNLLTRGQNEMPSIPVKPKSQRGKIAKSDAHNLCERLQQYETAVLLFAKMPEVPFTNNRAERDLRMSKVKQKVSGCFRKEEYAHAYCRISGYLQTMSAKGYNPLAAIQMAFSGEIYMNGV